MKARYWSGFELSPGVRATDNNSGAMMMSSKAKNRRVIFMERCYKQRGKKKSRVTKSLWPINCESAANFARGAKPRWATQNHGVEHQRHSEPLALFLFFF